MNLNASWLQRIYTRRIGNRHGRSKTFLKGRQRQRQADRVRPSKTEEERVFSSVLLKTIIKTYVAFFFILQCFSLHAL